MEINFYIRETDTFLRKIAFGHVPSIGSEIEIDGIENSQYQVTNSKYCLIENEIRIRVYLKKISKQNFFERGWLGRLIQR